MLTIEVKIIDGNREGELHQHLESQQLFLNRSTSRGATE